MYAYKKKKFKTPRKMQYNTEVYVYSLDSLIFEVYGNFKDAIIRAYTLGNASVIYMGKIVQFGISNNMVYYINPCNNNISSFKLRIGNNENSKRKEDKGYGKVCQH